MQAIVFVLRGGPAGALGAYGNEWVATPHLDQFATNAFVFDQHISDGPTTEAARHAWRTGHSFPAQGSTPDLFHELRAAKVHTVLVRGNHPETDGTAWAEHFDEVLDARPQAEDPSPLDELARSFPPLLDRLAAIPSSLIWVEIDRLLPPWEVPQDVFELYLEAAMSDDEPEDDGEFENEGSESDGSETVEELEAVAEEDRAESEEETDDEDEDDDNEDMEDEIPEAEGERIPPWSDPPVGLFDTKDLEAWNWLHCSFAAVMTALDAELGRLLSQLPTRGSATPLVAITSDFGWPLGEHGQVGPHRPWLYEELVHVPLLISVPNELTPRHIDALTQPTDLMPTLCEWFGLPATTATPGLSLWPLLRGEVPSLRPHVLSEMRIGLASERAIRTPEWALLVPEQTADGDPPRSPQLFRKPEDRWEFNDLRQQNQPLVEELEQMMNAEFGTRSTE